MKSNTKHFQSKCNAKPTNKIQLNDIANNNEKIVFSVLQHQPKKKITTKKSRSLRHMCVKYYLNFSFDTTK